MGLGLLVMDPTLIMIVTKENVAAHAFAKHFLRLELPTSINTLVGRLGSTLDLRGEWAQCTVWPQLGLTRSELCSVGTGVTEKVTKIDHSFLGLSSPVLFPGVRVLEKFGL